MALITQADVEAKLGRTLTAEEVTSFTITNASVQAQIERIIGSSVEDATVTTRYYDGGVQHLKIDPCTDIDAITYVDDDQVVYDTLDATDYVLDPINSTMKTQLRHRVVTPTGICNVGVTAKFSIYADAKVLAIVKDCILGSIVNEIQNIGNVKSESIEGYSVTFDNTATADALAPIKYLFPEV
jgi:hypothetical protein